MYQLQACEVTFLPVENQFVLDDLLKNAATIVFLVRCI